MQNALTLLAEGSGRMPQAPVEPVPARLSRAGTMGGAANGESPASAGLARAIDRLEEVVEQETAALRSRAQFDLKEFNTRKSHGLLELTRAMRALAPADPSEPMRMRLAQLRARLETNRAVIAMHLEAVREISTMMADAMTQADSDGTYSASIAGIGPKP